MRLTRPIAVFYALCSTSNAFAQSPPLCSLSGPSWTYEILVAMLLLATAAWYAAGLRGLARERRLCAKDGLRAASFAGGVLILSIALQSPLRALSHELFAMHMVQHMLLMLAAPPLFVVSRPGAVFWHALPDAARARITAIWARGHLRRGFEWLTHPLVIWIAFCGGFMFWHAPAPHLSGMRNAGIEMLEYLTFFVTSLGFWSIVIASGPDARLGHGARLLFLTTAAVLTDLPGALMVFAPKPLYPEHADGVREWGLTLMQDQQIAGLIMWVPGGIVFVCIAGVLFVAWLREAERRALAFTNHSTLAIALVCGCLLLAACGRSNSEPAMNFGGDAQRGKQLIGNFGCGSCHMIPNIADAKGNVGPPLMHIASRTYIAGVLRNSPDNLSLWISHPQQIVPGNAMPDMHISAEDARDITAFLYTLK